jgi:hypothetical protein
MYCRRCALLWENMMNIQKTGYPLTISNRLISILNKEIELHSEVDTSSGCVLNFRDPDYSAESGGLSSGRDLSR